jgi:hypothetical protein
MLDATPKKHEIELHEMEVRKQDLQEPSNQQRFRSSNEVSSFEFLTPLKMAFHTLYGFLFRSYRHCIYLTRYPVAITSQYCDHDNIGKAFERGCV